MQSIARLFETKASRVLLALRDAASKGCTPTLSILLSNPEIPGVSLPLTPFTGSSGGLSPLSPVTLPASARLHPEELLGKEKAHWEV